MTEAPDKKTLNRAEAARHAALVRWKKESPFGKPDAARVAALVRQKLAKKGRKRKVKPVGPTSEEKKNQARALVAKQTGMADLEGVMVRLGAGMQGAGMENDAHDKLIAKGLATRHANGTVTLTAAGKRWRSAADKGDVEGARAVLTEAEAGASDKEARETERASKLAERVAKQQEKQGKLAKAKAGGGGKKKAEKEKAKEEDAPSQSKQAENRAKVAKDMADQDVGLSPAGSAALSDFADGGNLPEATAAQFETMGIVERSADGTPRLTYAGRTAALAMNRGDMRAAVDAITRAGDRKNEQAQRAKDTAARTSERDKAKAERETEKAAREKEKADRDSTRTAKEDASRARVEAARIEAARSRTRKAWDMDDLFDLDDLLAIKAGARHSRGDVEHLQRIHDSAVACGASCGDVEDESDGEDDPEDFGKAIKGIMDNPLYYAQHECQDIMQAAAALNTMAMLIASELAEEDEDDAHITMLCDAADILADFVKAEIKELRGASSDAAETVGHEPMKGMELATLSDGEEIAVVHGYSVKALNDEGLVGGYLVKFGGDGDLTPLRDIFTKNTNYGSHRKSDVWVHHRMLPGLGKKQLTNQAELGMDDEGVFVKHLLDLRNAYEAKLYSMAQNGKLGWSSGTAPNLVERKAMGDGRHEITQWPLGLDASYTPMPAGGFVVNANAMKSLFEDAGIDLLNAMYIDDNPEAIKSDSTRRDGVEVDDGRARRLLLELSLLELETA